MRVGDKITVVVTALDFEPLRTRRGTVRSRFGGRITYDWRENMATLVKDARGNLWWHRYRGLR